MPACTRPPVEAALSFVARAKSAEPARVERCFRPIARVIGPRSTLARPIRNPAAQGRSVSLAQTCGALTTILESAVRNISRSWADKADSNASSVSRAALTALPSST